MSKHIYGQAFQVRRNHHPDGCIRVTYIQDGRCLPEGVFVALSNCRQCQSVPLCACGRQQLGCCSFLPGRFVSRCEQSNRFRMRKLSTTLSSIVWPDHYPCLMMLASFRLSSIKYGKSQILRSSGNILHGRLVIVHSLGMLAG